MAAKVTGDGHQFDGCSDGVDAADDGMGGEWADADVFGGGIKGGEERYGQHGGVGAFSSW